MKRFVTCILLAVFVLTSLFAFAACKTEKPSEVKPAGETPTAAPTEAPTEVPTPEPKSVDEIYEIYTNAIKKMEDMKDINFVSVGDNTIKYVSGDETEEEHAKTTIELKVSNLGDKDAAYYYLVKIESTEHPEESGILEYIATKDRVFMRGDENDKYMYMVVDEAESEAFGESWSDTAMDQDAIDKEYFEKAKYVEEEDGSAVITIDSAETDKFSEDIQSVIDSIKLAISNKYLVSEDDITIDAKSLKSSFKVNAEGYYTKVIQEITVVAKFSDEGKEYVVTLTANQTADVIDPGKPVTIDIPKDEDCELYEVPDYFDEDYTDDYYEDIG